MRGDIASCAPRKILDAVTCKLIVIGQNDININIYAMNHNCGYENYSKLSC